MFVAFAQHPARFLEPANRCLDPEPKLLHLAVISNDLRGHTSLTESCGHAKDEAAMLAQQQGRTKLRPARGALPYFLLNVRGHVLGVTINTGKT
jgi:hypothetical protein